MTTPPAVIGTISFFDSRDVDRPDVAVIVTTSTVPDRVIQQAVLDAQANGGTVEIIRLVDLVATQPKEDVVCEASIGREALARSVVEYLGRHPTPPITERLHHGTLASLLENLEPRFGMLVAWGDDLAVSSHVPTT